jgi:phospholipid/cholesterol/gamma-HCH transport system permease protein
MLTKGRRETSRTDAERGDHAPTIDATEQDGVLRCTLSGIWNTRTLEQVEPLIRKIETRTDLSAIELDLTNVRKMDTAGAWVIKRMTTLQAARGAEANITGASESVATLLAAVDDAARQDPVPPEMNPLPLWARPFDLVGRTMVDLWQDFIMGMNILGATIRGAQMKLGRKSAINPAAIVSQIDHMGVGAIPIVVLMSAIVGAIVAQQGAFQLRYFGAEIFVVDLVGILVLREMGVLLTAIMVAGRSGSAITAEIGSMKMREEVDALKVIGLNPVGVLVFPRLVALVVALPCLTVIANFAALGGAITLAWLYSGITPDAFIVRMKASIDISTILAGLIKAPFMAMIIGIIASVEGLKVGGSAESLGRHVTSSVVKSIFVVIVVDGFFAIFYAAINF